MLVFTKVKRISLSNLKNGYIMLRIIILNIIWLHHIFLESQQITEPVRNTSKFDEVIQVQNRSETKPINWDSSRPGKWIYFA